MPEVPAHEAAPRAGFALPRDIIIAPAKAYRAILARPEWLPATLIMIVSSLLATVLIAPAIIHATHAVALANSTEGSRLSPAAVDDAIRQELAGFGVQEIFMQLTAWSLTAMVLTTAARLRSQTTSFATYFSLAANCGVISALGGLIQGLVIRSHDPGSFATLTQVNRAIPLTLAALDPHGSFQQIAFLTQFDVFLAWGALLIAYGYAAISGAKLLGALFLSFGIVFTVQLLIFAVSIGS